MTQPSAMKMDDQVVSVFREGSAVVAAASYNRVVFRVSDASPSVAAPGTGRNGAIWTQAWLVSSDRHR